MNKKGTLIFAPDKFLYNGDLRNVGLKVTNKEFYGGLGLV